MLMLFTSRYCDGVHVYIDMDVSCRAVVIECALEVLSSSTV